MFRIKILSWIRKRLMIRVKELSDQIVATDDIKVKLRLTDEFISLGRCVFAICNEIDRIGNKQLKRINKLRDILSKE